MTESFAQLPTVRLIPDDADLPLEFQGLPRSIDEARAIRGCKFYWADRSCKKGHVGPHYKKNLQCVLCARGGAVRAKTRRLGMIGGSPDERPFVHILPTWSPVMVNIAPLLAVEHRDEVLL